MTQLEQARAGVVTAEMDSVARSEQIEPETVREEVARGRMVIPANRVHLDRGLQPIGIGAAARTKINANLGNSPISSDSECEIQKVRCAVRYGADTVMDLSTGPNIDAIRQRIIDAVSVPVGTVPIYQVAEKLDDIADMTPRGFLDVVEQQARQGVDYMTIHCAILRAHLPLTERRLTGIVSRGGSLAAKWMTVHNEENPFYTHFDDLCDIMRAYDVTWSLGDGLRPGSVADASDEAQFAELEVMGQLARRAKQRGCQVMIEGPGHIPIDEIEANVKVMKRLSGEKPFYMLGPLVTDIAPGRDHIVAAIGASLSSAYGADFICYVTPAEHLALPNVEDVREGVMASRIAAHVGDMIKNGNRDQDLAMGRARRDLLWPEQFDLALDPETAKKMRAERAPADSQVCTMCGDFCAHKIVAENLDIRK